MLRRGSWARAATAAPYCCTPKSRVGGAEYASAREPIRFLQPERANRALSSPGTAFKRSLAELSLPCSRLIWASFDSAQSYRPSLISIYTSPGWARHPSGCSYCQDFAQLWPSPTLTQIQCQTQLTLQTRPPNSLVPNPSLTFQTETSGAWDITAQRPSRPKPRSAHLAEARRTGGELADLHGLLLGSVVLVIGVHMVIPVGAGWRTAASSEPSQTRSRPLQLALRFFPRSSLSPPPPPHFQNLRPEIGYITRVMSFQHPAPWLNIRLL